MEPLKIVDLSGFILSKNNNDLFIDGYPINPHLWAICNSSFSSTIAFDMYYKTAKVSEHLNIPLLTFDGHELKYATDWKTA